MENYGGASVLVTGGLGFIGSTLAIRLVEAGARVTIVDSLDPGCGGNPFNIDPIRNKAAVRIGDVRDAALMRELAEGQDFIFNIAGQVSHILSMEDPLSDLEMNARAPLTLLEACRRVNPRVRIVYTSTRQVYGRADFLPVTESHPTQPVDINGANKIAGESYHRLYHEVHGVRTVSLRLVNTFGPRQLVKHARQGFIGWFIRLASDGSPIQIFGDGTQLRDITYVDDVVDAILLAAATPSTYGGTFNLGATAPVSVESFTQKLIAIAGRGSYRLVPFPSASATIDIGSIYCDFSNFRKATGWAPATSLDDAIRRTLDFYKEHREQYW